MLCTGLWEKCRRNLPATIVQVARKRRSATCYATGVMLTIHMLFSGTKCFAEALTEDTSEGVAVKNAARYTLYG
jgi:hypothetical protein